MNERHRHGISTDEPWQVGLGEDPEPLQGTVLSRMDIAAEIFMNYFETDLFQPEFGNTLRH
jgi:hypothetical protein